MAEKVYVAIGPRCWGKGNTQDAAMKNCRKNWSWLEPVGAGMQVYECDADSDPGVNEVTGGLMWEGDASNVRLLGITKSKMSRKLHNPYASAK